MLPAKVLIIDDSEIVRACVSEILKSRGVQVFELPSAIGATSKIIQHGIRTVIVDVNMPGLSGDRLVKVFRLNQRIQDIGVIIMTERSEEERQKLKQSSGADVVISKGDIQQLPIILGQLEADLRVPLRMKAL